MFIRYSSKAITLGTVALCVAAAVISCGGDNSSTTDDDDSASGGKAATDDDDGEAGNAGDTGGTGTGGSDGTAGGGLDLTPVACDKTPAPDSGLITDFSELESGTSWSSGSQKWGDTTFGGGTFHYKGNGEALTATVNEAGAVEFTGTVPASDYAGFGLWLTSCTSAADFAGITFTLGGDLGGASVLFQMQMSEDYPIDEANSKGECVYTSEDTAWSECTNNQVTLGTPDPGVLEFEWAQFKGGTPKTPLDPSQLLGIQWQVECQTEEDCVVDFTLDDLKFLKTVTDPFTQKPAGTGGSGTGGGASTAGAAGGGQDAEPAAAGAGGAAG
jgi:hypothetical protein